MEKFLFACMYVCMYVCMYPSDFARELEVKCSRGHVRITADRLQEVTGSIPGNDMLFFFPSFCNVHACASAASAYIVS